ncbi:MAG: hypothetical protein HY985_13105 [Magnetospirillum sp.]|nr:hypothetical protein [Magnetospirillum sp.]
MSAIAGICMLAAGEVESAPAERMAARLIRAGVEATGSYRSPEGRVALAAGGSVQPLANETHDVWLVLDGEIVNARALGHSLTLLGHRFRTGADAEVALHAYEQWGTDFLGHLSGPFALALWDDRRDRLVLARDRLGRKPLYLAERHGRLGFASAIAPLLDEMGLPRRLHAPALAQHLALGFVAPPLTLVDGIAKLAAGEMLSIERGRAPRLSSWAAPQPEERRCTAIRALSAERHVDNLRTLLECAVADRMMGDASPGLLLSPDLASSLVAAVTTRLAGRPAAAVAVHAAGAEGEAAAHALAGLAAAAGCEATMVAVTAEEAAAALPRLAARLPEPAGDPALLATWLAARAGAERKWTAMVAAPGASELLLGHPGYEAARRNTRMWTLKRLFPARLRAALWPSAPFAAPAVPGPLAALAGAVEAPVFAPLLPAWLGCDPLTAAAAIDLKGRGAEMLWPAVDGAAQDHGVEVRLPFLDEALAGYAAAVPGRLMARMLVRLARPLLPAAVDPLPALPLAEWLAAGPLAEAFARRLAASPLFAAGLNRGAVGGLNGEARWALLVLAEWHDALGLEGVAGVEEGQPAAVSG